MSKVLIFTPKHKLDYQKNYIDFIDHVKNQLTIFNDSEYEGKKGWESDKWKLNTRRVETITFGVSENSYAYKPYKVPFSDFARAYVRYEMSLKSHGSKNFALALPYIYQALENKAIDHGKPDFVDLMDIDNSVIDNAERLIRNSGLAIGTQRNKCISLEKIIKLIREKKLKLNLQNYKNPIPRPKSKNIKLDDESRQEQKDKCPSDYQMLQVASAFHNAKTPKQKFVTSLCVILMCQPSRVLELSALTVNSLQKSDKGRLYLQWFPAKGGDPIRKWVPKVLEDVVQQAFTRLKDISKPARKAAKFAYENPDKFMVHDDCITSIDYPQDIPLTYNQFASAMGLSYGLASNGAQNGWVDNSRSIWLGSILNKLNKVDDWQKDLLKGDVVLPDNRIAVKGTNRSKNGWKISDKKIIFPSYRDAAQHVGSSYKLEGFPNYSNSGVKLWDCITLIRENEFHKDFQVKPFSWNFLEVNSFNDAIGSGREGIVSIFQELELTDEDGSQLKLTTHQFRHWLNTKLQLGGVDEWLIAKWSGRANINQNKEYDGRTTAQKSRLTRLIGQVKGEASSEVITNAEVSQMLSLYSKENPPPPLILHNLGLGLSLKSLGVPRDGVAQFTGLGYCTHNYAASPCIKNSDCMVCREHVCLKGLPNSLEELKTLEALLSEQFEGARKAQGEHVFGADRWESSLGFRLAKIRFIINTLENPNNPDGTLARIPDELDPSPVKRSLMKEESSNELSSVIDLMALTKKNLEFE